MSERSRTTNTPPILHYYLQTAALLGAVPLRTSEDVRRFGPAYIPPKEAAMLVFLLAAVFATQLPTAALAQDIPHFSMTAMCSTEAKTDPCVQSEGQARTELQRNWSKFLAAARPLCLQEVNMGGPPSYTELLVCLQMADWEKAQMANQPKKEPETTGATSKPPSKPH